MNYEKLDNEELLRLALDAMTNSRDADAVVMLKTLLEREPGHVHAQYLLAAQHAQMNLLDRAEAGFRAVVAKDPGHAMARFQLGQLLVMKGDGSGAIAMLGPLTSHADALGAYARAMCAAANEDVVDAVGELEAGLQLPQAVPALAEDMRRLLERLRETSVDTVQAATASGAVSPLFLTGYNREP